MFGRFATFATLVVAPLALAQTFTDCNPLEKKCDPDSGLQASSFSSDFTQGAAKGWSLAAGTTINYGSKGAEFTIAKEGQAPTIESDFHILFGTVEVTMQAAPGTGIVSSIVLESADLDEIDWEFLGGNTAQVETNYFGKGDTTTYDRAIYYPVSSPQTSVHTYKIDWSPSRIIFYVDGNQVRVINYADAKGGTRYPQTPMKVKLGNWAGGAPGSPAGTVEWAGGATNFAQAPFTMYVQSIKITNMYPAKEYIWSDNSGTWQSIKAVQSGDASSKATSEDTSSKGSKDDKTTTDASTKKGNDASTKKGSDSKTDESKTAPKPVGHAVTDDKNGTKPLNHTTPSNTTHTSPTPKPVRLDGNGTTTTLTTAGRTTTSKGSPAIAAATTGAKTNSSSSSSSSGSTASSSNSGATSTSPALAGTVLLFTLCMCLWML